MLFLRAAGLDLLEVNLINCFYMGSIVLFEVPTGMLADRYGRKASFVVSCFVYSVSMFLYYKSGSFAMFVLAEVLGAIAASFYSGAFEAWMVDSVMHQDSKFDFEKVFVVSGILDNLGLALGTVLGAYFGKNNLALPWLMSSVSIALVGFAGMRLIREDYFAYCKTGNSSETGWLVTALSRIKRNFILFKESVVYTISNQSILFIVLAGVLFNFACMAPNMYWQIVFSSFDVGVDRLGIIHMGSIGMIVLGSLILKQVSARVKKQKHVIVCALAVFAFGLLLAVKDGTIAITLIGFYVHEFARGLYKPMQKKYINARLESRFRATWLSCDSMYSKIGALAGLLLSGFLAKYYSVSLSWLVSALVILFFLPFLYSMKNEE